MFFLPAGIKKQGVAEKAAIIHAAGCVSPIGAWGGRGQKSRQGGEGKKAMSTVLVFESCLSALGSIAWGRYLK